MSQELTTSTGPRLLFTIRLMCKRVVWEVVWEKVMTFLPFLTASSPGSPSQHRLPLTAPLLSIQEATAGG